MADATVRTDDEHSPIQLVASSSTAVIPVASVPDIITSILHDDRFKKELASLVDNKIEMKSALHPSGMYQLLLLQLRRNNKRLMKKL